MQALTLHFTPTDSDYVRAAGDLQRKQTHPFLSYSVYFILAAVIVLYFIFKGGLTRDIKAWLPMGVLLVVFVAGLLNMPRQVKKQFRANPALFDPTIWEVDEQELVVKTELTVVRYDWRSFREVCENAERYIFLFTNDKNHYLLLPKRAFESKAQMEQFNCLWRDKVRPPVQKKV